MNSIPAYYPARNSYESSEKPGTIHAADTGLYNYFYRALLQKAMAVFKWSIPETWPENYFLYRLFEDGYVGVFNTVKFGTVVQGGALSGYNLYYQPTMFIVANPLLPGIGNKTIGKDCEIIKLQPDYDGVADTVGYYASMMAQAAEAQACSLTLAKVAYVFITSNKAGAESFKTAMKQIINGDPAVFLDKSLFDSTGEPAWQLFDTHIKENFLAPDLLEHLRKLDDAFCAEVGLPNISNRKAERMITDEQHANDAETHSRASLWLDTLNRCFEKVREMFPDVKISAEFRDDGRETNVNDCSPLQFR